MTVVVRADVSVEFPRCWAQTHGEAAPGMALVLDEVLNDIGPSGTALLDDLTWASRDPAERSNVVDHWFGGPRPRLRPVRPYHTVDGILLRAMDVSLGSAMPRIVLAPAERCTACGGNDSKWREEDGILVCIGRRRKPCGVPWPYTEPELARPEKRPKGAKRSRGPHRVVNDRIRIDRILAGMLASAEHHWDATAWLAFCRAAYRGRSLAPLRVVAEFADMEAWATPPGGSRRRWGTASTKRALRRARERFMELQSGAS